MNTFKKIGLFFCIGIIGVVFGVVATMQWPKVSAAENGHEHKLTAHHGQEATCEAQGCKAYWECPTCNLYFADENGLFEIKTDLAAWKVIEKAGHTLYHHDAEEATCTAEGHTAYYECIHCATLFEDAACQKPAGNKNYFNTNKIAHEIEAVAATEEVSCDKPGYYAHFACKNCGLKFKDQEGTEIYPEAEVIDKPDHVMGIYQEEKPATCQAAGQVAHFHCAACGNNYADENYQTKIDDIIIPQLECEGKLVEGYAATCTKTGLVQHYVCTNGCNGTFTDAACENKIDSVIIDKINHDLKWVKVNEGEQAQYTDQNGDGTYEHGCVSYNQVCVDCGHVELKINQQWKGFAELNTANNDGINIIENRIAVEHEISYDHIVVDWENNDNPSIELKFTPAENYIHVHKNNHDNVTFKFSIKVQNEIKNEQYDVNEEYVVFSENGNIEELPTANDSFIVLTMNAEHLAQGKIFVWEFDWDGDGNYEQTIKINVFNYNV